MLPGCVHTLDNDTYILTISLLVSFIFMIVSDMARMVTMVAMHRPSSRV